MIRLVLILLITLATCGNTSAQTPEAVRARVANESTTSIRPGVPGTSPFWNEHAKQFMFAPAFDFKPVDGATSYRFTLVSADGKTHSFEASEPWAPLSPIWTQIPSGKTELSVEGLKDDMVVGRSGSRTFHRAAVFNGPYGQPVLQYGHSARIALATVMNEPFVKSWRFTGKPDPNYALYRYASKVIGSLVSGCAMYANQSPRPKDADAAIETGRRAADFLIGISHPPGTPLEHFPP